MNRGKGAAVRRGVLESRGAYVLFMDADLSTPIEEVEKLLVYVRGGADVVIGSRGLAESDIRVHQPFPREAMGRIFNVLVRSLLMGGFKDTQCGFKLFTREAAHALFSKQELDGFAFDVEVLLLAKELGYRIREVPVVWYHAPNSKVSPVTDASRMFRDLVKLRARKLLRR
jgi:dolichyl-phosphate beta-glucosyltransferase